MKTYIAGFEGREKNAIGITYKIVDTVKAENKKDARLKLYDKYDLVLYLSLTEKK